MQWVKVGNRVSVVDIEGIRGGAKVWVEGVALGLVGLVSAPIVDIGHLMILEFLAFV